MLTVMMFIYNSLSEGANNVLEVKIINKAWEPITVQMKNHQITITERSRRNLIHWKIL